MQTEQDLYYKRMVMELARRWDQALSETCNIRYIGRIKCLRSLYFKIRERRNEEICQQCTTFKHKK